MSHASFEFEDHILNCENLNKLSLKHSKNIIAVDSREFSCLTPIHLYLEGFWVIPMVLTVGDYIISDQICIERKAVSTGDLLQSFTSGRLYE